MWWIFALLSALFAALTAIFAKIGIKGVDTDLATAIRTVVILILAWGIAFFRGGTSTMNTFRKQNIIFLCLSGIATGLSWIFYFKALQLGEVSQVAPVDKMSVAFAIIIGGHIFGRTSHIKNRDWCIAYHWRKSCFDFVMTLATILNPRRNLR